MSITLGARAPACLTPPGRVVTSLATLGLPLACLPSLLAVYREVGTCTETWRFL